MGHGLKLCEADKLRLWNNSRQWGRILPKQARDWIGNAAYLSDEMVKHGEDVPPPVRALYWIRLYGVLSEIRKKLAEHQEVTLADLSRFPPKTVALFKTLRFEPAQRLLERIDAVKALLTEDELLYVQYIRDSECHPWQDYYRLRLDRSGSKLLETRDVFGRKWHVDELDSRLRAFARSHWLDEAAIASAVARKIAPALEAVHEASQALYDLKAWP